MTPVKPETLSELLKTLERSSELRSLARECGLSVRELRRRLSIWRRELVEEDGAPDPPADIINSPPSLIKNYTFTCQLHYYICRRFP